MNIYIKYSIILFLLILLLNSASFAQSTRGLINEGVDLYKEQKFADAEVNFKKGTEKNPESFEAKFNLGDAYYKQQRYDEAIKTFQSSFENAKNDEEKAKIYHNIGNSLLKSQKIRESIGAYKEALKHLRRRPQRRQAGSPDRRLQPEPHNLALDGLTKYRAITKGMTEQAKRTKVAIVGFASSSRDMAPYGDPSFEIWSMNHAWRKFMAPQSKT